MSAQMSYSKAGWPKAVPKLCQRSAQQLAQPATEPLATGQPQAIRIAIRMISYSV